MSIELKIPEVGESITEVEIGDWLKAEGETVAKDEDVVTVESEKASVDLPAPVGGILKKILKRKGAKVNVGEVIAEFEPSETLEKSTPSTKSPAKDGSGRKSRKKEAPPSSRSDSASASTSPKPGGVEETKEGRADKPERDKRIMPAARRLLEEHELKAEEVEATGPGGRLLKEDVLGHVQEGKGAAETSRKPLPAEGPPSEPSAGVQGGREEEVVPMSPLRRTVARRLLEARQTMAMLTTFNEIDLSAVGALRQEYRETFLRKYEVKLGLTSFFVKAVVDALKRIPQLNAEARGDDIVYHNYYDIGVAIGSGRGLVVPVLRDADRMSFAEIETAIDGFAQRAQAGKIRLEDLEGGTFTITNGGVYGSLLSTPIINPPQSGILGLHAIQERPVAVGGQVMIRPMMYVALTYDHRLVDGREAVTFLKRVKDAIETPARMLLEV
jgi:2-oxoglutarate dehydrogenase E2 component (dihydrolipoamide succinyltransferase)